MSVHEQFADDLGLYALGVLGDQARAALENHLKQCADCQRELEQLQGDMALLALSASGPKPPRRSRRRLMAAIAKESGRLDIPERRPWWRALEWVAAAAAVIAVVLLLQQNRDLRRRIANLEKTSSQQQDELMRAKEVAATLTSPDAVRFTLVMGKSPQPQGKAIYLRSRSSLIFFASNMPALPPQRAYELWLIPTSGAPIPAGVFKPDAHGSATVINPPLPAGVEAKTFAITVEPETGSAAPTSSPIMVGAGG